MQKMLNVKDEKTYWEELVSELDGQQSRTNPDEPGINPNYLSDLEWASGLKSQLKKVFVWDYFNKKNARNRIDEKLGQSVKPSKSLINTVWARAAMLLLAIMTGALVNHLVSNYEQNPKYAELSVPLGQMSQLKLPDGSKIYLNSGTVFKYPTTFGKKNREVFIDGEAFMEISKNKHKPFVVNAANFTVKVLGTSFNVSAYSGDEQASITLIEGSVQLQSKEKGWNKNMVPGEIATVSNGNKPIVEQVDTEFYTSWTEGKITFRKETLQEIAKKLERWYNVDIRFGDEQLKQFEFSGTFLKNKPVEQVFKTLSIIDERIDFITENKPDQKDIIYISRRNKK